jgi:hypothetical protein
MKENRSSRLADIVLVARNSDMTSDGSVLEAGHVDVTRKSAAMTASVEHVNDWLTV